MNQSRPLRRLRQDHGHSLEHLPAIAQKVVRIDRANIEGAALGILQSLRLRLLVLRDSINGCITEECSPNAAVCLLLLSPGNAA